MLFKLISEDI